MGKEMAKFGGFSMPAYLQKSTEPVKSDLDTGGSGGLGIPRISLKNSKFTILDPDGEQIGRSAGPAFMVVLGAAPRGKLTSKMYYEGEYDPENTAPPDCSSVNGVVPDSWIDNPPSDKCATCPMNEWGSGKGKSKACRDKKVLFVVNPKQVTGSPIMQMNVPPASLKGMSKYARDLSKHNIPVHAAVTELNFDEDEDYPVLTFGFQGFLSEEDYAAAESRLAEVEDLVDEYLGSEPASRTTHDEQSAENEAEEEEETPEPPKPATTKKKSDSSSKAAATAKKKAKKPEPEPEAEEAEEVEGDDELNNILSQWGG